MTRRAFTAIETLLVVGVLGISATLAVPLYRQYLLRNDLEIARQNVAQGIERAKFLSQVAMNDSAWGFSTDAIPGRGVIFMGDNFAVRNTSFDELYALPSSVSVTGVTEVTFEKISGNPSVEGIITLTSISGEKRTVNISIGSDGEVSIPEDWITVCMDPYGSNPTTLRVPDSLWIYYSDQGAVNGDCGDVSGGESGGESGGGPVNFTIDGDTVTPNVDYDCTVTILGISLDDNGAYDMPVTMRWRIDDWQEPFGDWGSPTTANINDGASHSFECGSQTAGTDINADLRSWVKQKYWYAGDDDQDWVVHLNKHTFLNNNDHIEVLADGDVIPSHPALLNRSTLKNYVAPYLDLEAGIATLGSNQALYLVELGTANLNQEEGDFQDIVLLIEIDAL